MVTFCPTCKHIQRGQAAISQCPRGCKTPMRTIQTFHELADTAQVLYCSTCDYISSKEELNPKYPEARCPHCAKILEGMTKGDVMAKRALKRPHTTAPTLKKKGTK